MRQTSLTRLYEAHRESLSLVHVSGPIGARLSVAEERIWPADLVGHLNLIHPTRLQVLGAAELAWAQRQANEKVAHHLNEILSARPPAIIVADGCEVPNILHGICEAHDVALFTARALDRDPGIEAQALRFVGASTAHVGLSVVPAQSVAGRPISLQPLCHRDRQLAATPVTGTKRFSCLRAGDSGWARSVARRRP